MRRFLERRRIARALERDERALDLEIQRELDAHRRVEALLRRGAPAAQTACSGTLRARVLAAIETGPEAPESERARRRGAGVRPSYSAPQRFAIAAAVLVLVGVATWLAFGPQDAGPEPFEAPLAQQSAPRRATEVAPTLAVLGELPRASTAKLLEAIDQPLLGEFDKLARDTRSLGRFLRGRVPALGLRADDDRGWR